MEGPNASEARKEFASAMSRTLKSGRLPVRTRGAGTWEFGPKGGLVPSPDGDGAVLRFKTLFHGWTRLVRQENPSGAEVGRGRMLCHFTVSGLGGAERDDIRLGHLPCPDVLAPLCDLEDSIVERIARKAGLSFVASEMASGVDSRALFTLSAGVTRQRHHLPLITDFFFESSADLQQWGEAIGQRMEALLSALARHLVAEADKTEARLAALKIPADAPESPVRRFTRVEIARDRALSCAIDGMLDSL
jgi:hypothetical protein